ncbi:MAG: SPFH domain-containing protein, partial [Deltaproteobacteria bacterium]|nr:SPFH domain-containing protein [Deltaproteobacteria bacterium]
MLSQDKLRSVRKEKLPWAFTSPIRSEVYFVNLKVFNNLKWGTRDP